MSEKVRKLATVTVNGENLRDDSTSNIARRYRHLFRLPSTPLAILFASLSAILIEILTTSLLGVTTIRIALYSLVTELFLIATIEIDRLCLRPVSPIATLRRLSAIAILSNLLWLLLTCIAAVVFYVTKSDARLVSLVMLGAFFAIAFRAIIFGSVFYDTPVKGLPLAVVQLGILLIPVLLLPGSDSIYSVDMLAALLGGAVAVAAIEVYLVSVDKPVKNANFTSLDLLRAFLSAWTIEEVTELEKFLDEVSQERTVKTTMIRFEGRLNEQTSSALLIEPGLHPGPFFPIGSSNLPADIYFKLLTPNVLPLTVHSISDHDLNLPSKSEVATYISSLRNAEIVERGETISNPVTRTNNKATSTGIALGHTLLTTLTQSPYGMEDFPANVGEDIKLASSDNGFKSSLVIDAHNSEGSKPDAQECSDAVKASIDVIEQLSKAEQSAFNLGFAHSSELKEGLSLPKDIGPAGVGLLLLESGGSPSYCLVIVDANNSKLGFREKIFERFELQTKSRILEICTSDTHVTAAKVPGAKGYLALGDIVSPEDFTIILASLHDRAKSRLSRGSFSTLEAYSNVKTIGANILNEFSSLLDKTSLKAKRGAEVLAIIAALITVIVATV